MGSNIFINEKDGTLQIDELTITAGTKIDQLTENFIILPLMRTSAYGREVLRQYAGAYFLEDGVRLKINLAFEDDLLVAVTIYFLDSSNRSDPKKYPHEWLSKKIHLPETGSKKYPWGSIGISVDPPSLEGYISIHNVNYKWDNVRLCNQPMR
jgi:hypothetical protein